MFLYLLVCFKQTVLLVVTFIPGMPVLDCEDLGGRVGIRFAHLGL